MVPDSTTAKKYACGRTKATAVASTLAQEVAEKLAADMNKYAFSLSTDGSNDNSDKLFPMVVRCFDEQEGLVKSRVLSVPQLSASSNALNIAQLCQQELQKFNIDYKNMISFCSDNTAVMVGCLNGVTEQLRKKNDQLMTVGCVCHLLDLAAKKAFKTLPVKIDELLLDIFYFLEPSDKRIREFKEYQLLHNEEVRKILKYCPTRWLSLGKCVDRLIELWVPLKAFVENCYKQEKTKADKKAASVTKKQSAEAGQDIINGWFKPSKDAKPREGQGFSNMRLKRIYDAMISKRTLAYCLFVSNTIRVFEKANTSLQHDKPLVHKVIPIVTSAFRELLVMLIKPAVISSSTDITTVKFTIESNHLPEKDLFFGEGVSNITQKMTRSSRLEFYMYAKDFLMKALAYMKDKFPFKDPVLEHARVIDPAQRHTTGMSDLLFFLQKIHGFDKSTLQTQFQLYLSYPLPANITNLNRVDSQWHELMKFQDCSGDCIFKELARAMLCLCSIPHSNAAAERAFSMVRKNRTSQRASLSTQSLEAILVTKFGGASTGQLSDPLLRKCKSATYKSLHK